MWKRFLHIFGFHDWSPWDNPRILGDGRSHQFRKCLICHKQQRNIF